MTQPERFLYGIEWTHGDGMDQHQEFAWLTREEANDVRGVLDEREALEPAVWEISETMDLEELMDKIKDDLPTEDDE